MREPAAETLLEHADFLRALARSILKDEHAAEDVAQEALTAAGRRPGVRAWLGAVARNLAISRLRADKSRARREEAAARPEAHGDVPEAVARLEAQQQVVEAVLALDPPYRAVVLERFFYDRPLPEVAERLGVPSATARTRLRRALATLRARLERRMGPAAMVAALSLLSRPAGATAITGVILMSSKPKIAAALALVLLLAGVWVLFSARGTAGGARGVAAESNPDSREEPADPAARDAEALVAGPLVTGRSVDLRWDAPLEGARARVGASEAMTDSQGRFAVPWMEGSSAPALVVSKEGYADAFASLPLERGDADLGDVVLRPLLVIKGVVVTADGAPAARASVSLRGGGWDGQEYAMAAADEAGRFSLPVPAQASAPGAARDDAALQVVAYLPGCVEGAQAVGDPDEELRIRLGAARTVRGVVVDEVTGKGVPGAALILRRFKGEGWRAGVSGPDGSFEVGLYPLPEQEGHIVPGMEVRAEGYSPKELQPQDLARDGNRIVLERATIVRGRLTRADGRPAGGIEVTSVRLVHRPPPSSEAARRLRDERESFDLAPPCARTKTDSDGWFTVSVPRTPPYRISAMAWPLGAEVDLTSLPDQPLSLVLDYLEDYHGLLRVRAVDPAGRPIEGANVTWWAVPGAAGEGMSSRSPGSDGRTDSDGYAEVWTNRTWTRPVLLLAWAPGWFGVSKRPVDRQRLVDAAEVVCEPAGLVRGRVVGAPLHHGARASLWWRVGGEVPWRVQLVRVGKDGRFALPGAPPGRSTLVVADPRGRSLLREIDAPAGGLLDLGDVALEPPAIVRGVSDAGAWVWWEPKEPYYRQVFVDPYWERVKADANGAFELPVWVQGPVYVWARGAPFMVAPEGTPQAGTPIPMGEVAKSECNPGDGSLTPMAGSKSRRAPPVPAR